MIRHSRITLINSALIAALLFILADAWEQYGYTLRGFDGHPCERVASSRPHYVPGEGTTNLYYGYPCDTPQLAGLPLTDELIVASDLGSNLVRIARDGRVRWRYPAGQKPVWSVFQRGNLVGFPYGSGVRYLESESGRFVRDRELWPNKDLRFVRPAGEKLILGSFNEGAGSIAIWSHENEIEWRNPYETTYARAADLSGSQLAIADSGAHRVYVVDIETNEIIFTQFAYYPADVRWLDDNTLLMTEEHANKISRIDIRSRLSSIVGACENKHEEGSCLYSPNSALFNPEAPTQLIVADSDNGRVVVLDADGHVETEIGGFRDPQSLVVVKARPDSFIA